VHDNWCGGGYPSVASPAGAGFEAPSFPLWPRRWCRWSRRHRLCSWHWRLLPECPVLLCKLIGSLIHRNHKDLGVLHLARCLFCRRQTNFDGCLLLSDVVVCDRNLGAEVGLKRYCLQFEVLHNSLGGDVVATSDVGAIVFLHG